MPRRTNNSLSSVAAEDILQLAMDSSLPSTSSASSSRDVWPFLDSVCANFSFLFADFESTAFGVFTGLVSGFGGRISPIIVVDICVSTSFGGTFVVLNFTYDVFLCVVAALGRGPFPFSTSSFVVITTVRLRRTPCPTFGSKAFVPARYPYGFGCLAAILVFRSRFLHTPDSGFLGLGAGAARVAGSGSKSGARPILGSGASPGSGPVCPGSGPDSGTGTGSCSSPGAGSSPGFGLGPNASSHSSCSGSVAGLFPAATGPIACPSSATSSSDPHEFVARRWAFHGASRACGVGCPIAGIRGFHSIPADRNCRYDSNFHTGGASA